MSASRESKIDSGRGPVASIIVTSGTLKKGDFFVSGLKWGKVRAIINDKGHNIEEALPSTPVEILGINGASKAGDDFIIFESEKEVKTLSESRAQEKKENNNPLIVGDLDSHRNIIHPLDVANAIKCILKYDKLYSIVSSSNIILGNLDKFILYFCGTK